MTLALLVAAVLAQAQSPHIKAAREAMAELRYPDAKTLLTKARQQQGLTRDQLIDILWMQGLVNAAMGQADAARTPFRALFAIDPDHKPDREYPPKIMSPYYEARGWVATNKPLGFAPIPASRSNGRVTRIGVKLLGDPLSLANSVRFHVAGQKAKEIDLKGLQATLEVDGEQVSWWAELIGERDARLGQVGDPKSPLVEVGAPGDAAREPKEDAREPKEAAREPKEAAREPKEAAREPKEAAREPKEAAREPPRERKPSPREPRVEQADDTDMPDLQPTQAPPWHPPPAIAWGSAALGVVTLSVGLVFGIRSNTEANALKNRVYDGTGTVVNFTQTEAVTLELQQRREAGVANAMFAISVIALGVAAVFFILERVL